MSTGSISTYRNKNRACCQDRTASSVWYAVFTAKRRGDVDISGILRKQLYVIHQRRTGHMDITLHGCRYVPKAAEEPWATYSVRWLWLRRYDGDHGTAYTRNPPQNKSPIFFLPYCSDNSNYIIPIPLTLFRRG